MLKLEYNEISWYYWLITVALLLHGVFLNNNSFGLVIGLSAIQVIHYLIKTREVTSFEVQFRMCFLMLMMLAQYPLLSWFYFLALFGLIAQLLFSYCLLEKCLKLMPWNRQTPLSKSLIKSSFSPFISKNRIINIVKCSIDT